MTYNSIFISDLHIGLKSSKVKELINFLKDNHCQNLYIVGDFFDGWELMKKWYWEPSYNLLIQKILRQLRKGTKVVYLVGNHDEFMENFIDHPLGGIEVHMEFIHKGINGDILLLHGQQFDGLLSRVKWLQKLGSHGYDILLKFNCWINHWQHKFGMSRWSLSKFVKTKVKAAICYLNNYEKVVCDYARKKGYKKVITGHIHSPCHKTIEGIDYFNCGDWVENTTCVVEEFDGTIKLININAN